MTEEIENMIREGVLEPAPLTPSYISPLFLLRKSNGKVRTIFNLKSLNQYMRTSHFRLFNHCLMHNFLQTGDWLAKFDLSQAYYHVPILAQHRCFLRISYQGRLMQMTCLPFGISVAPKIFATLSNWIAHFLRSCGLRVVVYLDDFLVANQSKKSLLEQVLIAKSTLINLGWQINYQKSAMIPTQIIEFLGITWNTRFNSRSLPAKKVSALRRDLQACLAAESLTVKETQRLLGRLNFANFVVHRGRLHCRSLQQYLGQLQKAPCHLPPRLPAAVRQDLQWWIDNATQQTHIHEELTRKLLTLADRLRVNLAPYYLPGRFNTEADGLSRGHFVPEWHLRPEATEKIFARWGTPSIDLFASESAHVVPRYVSIDSLDSNACYHDAFSNYWHYDLAWIFPPPSLLPRVLHHLNTASGLFIVITPKWNRPFWRPDLKKRAVKRPLKVHNLRTVLIDTTTNRPPPQVNDLSIEAWLLSGGML
ncbi:uncharacterized protein LOC134647505 [Cydia amplana]|uniref:uncharacterized protein LOC134647505 n=1 Tax=Cydia amplana TaxID=1869771 RepID=UPI002FE5E5DE